MMRPMLGSLLLAALLAGGGCATNTPTGPVHDPYEGFNRGVYRFNDALDRAVLKPVARGYRYVVPDFMEAGVNNFFSNLDDVTVIANDLLQGKFGQAASDTGRVVLNTTSGMLGFFDAGTVAGLDKHNESFGQTLGVWGAGEGPFLMLPLLGPANVRSALGRVPDTTVFSAGYWLIDDTGVAVGLTALDLIALRARLLVAGNLLDTAALDPYLLLRDVWVQNHRRLTVDGKVPVAIGLPADQRDDDGLDELDAMDGLDELDELDAMDDVDELDAMDELDELDRLDAIDRADDIDKVETTLPAGRTGQPDELDELDRLDALD